MESNRLIAAAKTAVILRNYQRARQRALTRLANAHLEEYKAYLKEEKHNDYTQGKAWVDLNGNTNGSLDPNTNSITGRSEGESSQTGSATRTGNL
jgi:hypothetical protein